MVTETGKDSLKLEIDKLNQQAWQMRVLHFHLAHDLSKQAVELARSFDYSKGLAEGLRTLGFSFIRKGRYTEALPHLNESLSLFQKLNDLHGQSDIYEYLGLVQRSLNDYGGSLAFLFKSLDLRQELNYKEGEAVSLYQLGVSYKYLGNYERALQHLLKSLSLSRVIPFEYLESYALNLIGQVYFETGSYANAMEYYQQSLSIRQNQGDKMGEAGSLNNIGLISFKMGNYEQSLNYCSQALAISEAISDRKGQGNSLFHLATIHHYLGHSKKALEYYSRSLEIRRLIKDKKGEAEALLFLAEIEAAYINRQQFKEHVFKLLKKALRLGQETRALDLLGKIHFSYYTLYKSIRDYKNSLIHFENFSKIDKESNKHTLDQKIFNLEIAHHVEQSRQEAEIYRLRNIELAQLYEESTKQKEEIENQKKVVEEALNQLKATKDRLIQQEILKSQIEIQEQTLRDVSQEIHDNIGQILTLIKLNIHTMDPNKAENIKEKILDSKQLISKAIEDLRDLSKTLNTDYITEIGLENALQQQLLTLQKAGSYKTRLKIKGCAYKLHRQQELIIFRIAQELLNNIIKHADATEVYILMHYQTERLVITVKDNGKGFDVQEQSGAFNKGLGLRNIQNRIALIHGTLAINSELKKGTLVTIELAK